MKPSLLVKLWKIIGSISVVIILQIFTPIVRRYGRSVVVRARMSHQLHRASVSLALAPELFKHRQLVRFDTGMTRTPGDKLPVV
mgnify:CR=1 FL=1